MLTLFTIPRSFRGHIAIIQRNAIQSWLQLRPTCEIILLGDDEGTADVAREFGLRHIPDVVCNEYDTPLVNDLFEKAQRLATHDLLCYVNTDIILMSDFMQAVERVARRKPRFLMIGQRWDIDVKGPLDFGPHWEERFRIYVTQNGQLHPSAGADYFVFRRGLWGEIPPFAIGRTVWDNWLLYRARSRRAPLIDATQVVMAVHQNHGYSHSPKEEEGIWKGPEAKRNLELAGGWSHVFTLRDATHLLTPKGLKWALDGWHALRHLRTSPTLYPYLRLPLRLLLKAIDFSHPVRVRLGLILPTGGSHNA